MALLTVPQIKYIILQFVIDITNVIVGDVTSKVPEVSNLIHSFAVHNCFGTDSIWITKYQNFGLYCSDPSIVS